MNNSFELCSMVIIISQPIKKTKTKTETEKLEELMFCIDWVLYKSNVYQGFQYFQGFRNG